MRSVRILIGKCFSATSKKTDKRSWHVTAMHVNQLMLFQVASSTKRFLAVDVVAFEFLASVYSDMWLKASFDVKSCEAFIAFEWSLDKMQFFMNFQSFWVLVASTTVWVIAFKRFHVLMSSFGVLYEFWWTWECLWTCRTFDEPCKISQILSFLTLWITCRCCLIFCF